MNNKCNDQLKIRKERKRNGISATIVFMWLVSGRRIEAVATNVGRLSLCSHIFVVIEITKMEISILNSVTDSSENLKKTKKKRMRIALCLNGVAVSCF